MALDKKDSKGEFTLNKKYRYNNLRQKHGVSKVLAQRICNSFLGEALVISISPDKEKRKFTVFVHDSVKDSVYDKFLKYWSDVFDVYRSNNKPKGK